MAQNLWQKLTESMFKRLYRPDPSHRGQFPSHLSDDTVQGGLRYKEYFDYLRINSERKAAYREYENMDSDVIASCLDLYADDSTQLNLKDGQSLYVNCENQEVKQILEDLYFNILDVESHIWSIVRTFAKYGDYFVRPIGEDGKGIKYCDYSIHPERVTRLDHNGVIARFILDEQEILNPWDLVHFKLPGKSPFGPSGDYANFLSSEGTEHSYANVNTYGMSVLDKARKPWKQLQLLENSLVLSRLSRSFKRNVFSVNTNGLGETAAWDLVDRIADLLKKNKMINPGVGMESYSTLLNTEEDIVLPVNGDKGQINVTELGGDVDIQHIADIDYTNNKLFASLKTPKAYVGFEEGLNGRNTLRTLDVRYARTIKNLQRVAILGLERIGRIHLSLLGRDPFAEDFTLTLPYISTIEEIERSEVISANVDSLTKILSVIDQIDDEKKIVDREALAEYAMKEMSIPEETIRKILNKTGDIGESV